MSEQKMITETRDVSGFEGVSLGGYGTVNITQGDRTSLTIEAAEDVLPRVVAEVKNGVLVLRLEKEGWLKGLKQKKQSIRFDVTMKNIKNLSLGGVGRIDAPRVDTDTLALVVSGVGAIEIGALSAESLDVILSGAGNCEVAGRVTSQTIKLSGAGNYKAPDLESQNAGAVVSGAGNVTVHATDTLDAKVTGAGSIRYQGAPTVRQRVTGVGSVVCTSCE